MNPSVVVEKKKISLPIHVKFRLLTVDRVAVLTHSPVGWHAALGQLTPAVISS